MTTRKSLVRRTAMICAVVWTAFWGSACSREGQQTPVTRPVRPAKIVEIADPARELMQVFPGTVVSSDNTVLAFRVSGRLIVSKLCNIIVPNKLV